MGNLAYDTAFGVINPGTTVPADEIANIMAGLQTQTEPDTSAAEPPSTKPQKPTDYSSLFTFFGLPSDLVGTINKMMAQYISSGMTIDDATTQILGYIRGTPWYAQTYPGIAYGLSSGLFDETQDMEVQYRKYVNEADQYSQQYLGSNVSSADIVKLLQSGTSAAVYGKQLEGQSYANAYTQDWNNILEPFGTGQFGNGPLQPNQALALGEEQVGYKTTLGDQLNKALQLATQRMQKVLKGTYATPADLQRKQTLVAPSLGAEVTPDVGAI